MKNFHLTIIYNSIMFFVLPFFILIYAIALNTNGNLITKNTSKSNQIDDTQKVENVKLFTLPEEEIKSDELTKNDFSVINGSDIISLDSQFSFFKTNSKKIDNENNSIGEITIKGHTYQYEIVKYKDFDIFITNIDYQTKKRNPQDKYISKITVKTENYSTPRNIKIGSSIYEVISKYGTSKNSFSKTETSIKYHYNNMELEFKHSKNLLITGISLRVIFQQ